ncbi:hypothetical protein GCM10007874_50350 [Labrys miyagiensis]|uniref:Uncharacterized protein n=1 Tax=Labrys miyagiensis TaxID=346912 RepID=A0ABQ6CNV5_9HYPH|nr:hypothetical protein GCM10007874_50350 [Labrys miyagiensis]
MATLADFCPNIVAERRLLNSLWQALYPADEARPPHWQPTATQVRQLNLRIIQGLGPKGEAIISKWLAVSPT